MREPAATFLDSGKTLVLVWLIGHSLAPMLFASEYIESLLLQAQTDRSQSVAFLREKLVF